MSLAPNSGEIRDFSCLRVQQCGANQRASQNTRHRGVILRKYLLAAAAAAAIATPAVARDGSGYVGVEGGILFPKDSDVDFAGTDA